jgi:hypothetical protein
MNFKEYTSLFDRDDLQYPEDKLQFIPLNKSRMNRWLKTGKIDNETLNSINSISEPQNWIVISEPWCGDAAHSLPFIYMLSELNPNIHLEIQLRDSNSEIDNYLTDGNRSIPKLIIRDSHQNDLFTWGARPAICENFRKQLKEQGMDADEIKIKTQQWYNEDKGQSLIQEILKGIN